MSVISISEKWDGRDGVFDLSGERTYARVFLVVTNSKLDTSTTILSTPGIPQLGHPFPDDGQAYCQNVNADQMASCPTAWLVTASYSNKNEVSDDPIDDAPEYEWSTEEFQRPVFFDKDGDGIVNSAGDPYVPAPEIEDSRAVLRITRNLSSVPTWVFSYRNVINSSAFTIDGVAVEPRQARISSINVGKKQERNDIEYRAMGMTMVFKEDTWDLEIMDAGFRQKVSSEMRIITNDDGTEITAPVPLDGSGEKLDPPTSGTIVFNNHRARTELDFNTLPIFP